MPCAYSPCGRVARRCSSCIPPPPGLAHSADAYLANVDERYVVDAYNSLSIEGYQVSDALIERVAKQGWNSEADEQDKKDRDALAARGYYQAFQAVRTSIVAILSGENSGKIVRALITAGTANCLRLLSLPVF